MVRKRKKLTTLSLLLGIIFVVVSYLLFKFPVNDFLTGAWQEIFSLGLVLIVFGIVLKLWKVKLG